jgi:hypothetical protein
MNDVLHVDLQDEEQLEEIRLTAALMVAAADAEALSQDSVDEILASSELRPGSA